MSLTRIKANNLLNFDIKNSCRVTSTSNITLSGGAPSTVDGISLAAGDRILVRGQATISQNGIYKVSTLGTGSNGTWVRDNDANFDNSITAGALLYVEEGTLYGGHFYYMTTIGNITINSSNISFNDLSDALSVSISSSQITNGTSNVVVASSGNVTTSVAGNANILTVTGTGANVSGTINVTGNANVGNLGTATAIITTANITTGNITTANITTINSGLLQNGNSNIKIAANSNITVSVTGVANVISMTNTDITVAANISPNPNATYNLGSTGSRWNTIWGVASSALYADLAENYLSDKIYKSGTVVIFGGETEITIASQSHDTRVAGVISTAPAYLMNDKQADGTWLPVALTGRTPTQVCGPINKGDLIVASDIPGVGIKMDKNLYEPGCIIGKSLDEIKDNSVKLIEIVIGRF